MSVFIDREVVKEINTWQCEECERSFKAKRSLSYHCFTKHGLNITKKKNSEIMKKQTIKKRISVLGSPADIAASPTSGPSPSSVIQGGDWSTDVRSVRAAIIDGGREVTLDEAEALITLTRMDTSKTPSITTAAATTASTTPTAELIKASSTPPHHRAQTYTKNTAITALKDTLKARKSPRISAAAMLLIANDNKNNNNNVAKDNNNNDSDAFDNNNNQSMQNLNTSKVTSTPTSSVEPTRRSRRLAQRAGDRRSFADVADGRHLKLEDSSSEDEAQEDGDEDEEETQDMEEGDGDEEADVGDEDVEMEDEEIQEDDILNELPKNEIKSLEIIGEIKENGLKDCLPCVKQKTPIKEESPTSAVTNGKPIKSETNRASTPPALSRLNHYPPLPLAAQTSPTKTAASIAKLFRDSSNIGGGQVGGGATTCSSACVTTGSTTTSPHSTTALHPATVHPSATAAVDDVANALASAAPQGDHGGEPIFETLNTTSIASRLDGVYVYNKTLQLDVPELKISLYKCELCSQFFPFWPLLRDHLCVCHFNDSPNILECMPSSKPGAVEAADQFQMYSCPECTSTFIGGASFARHLLTHKSEPRDLDNPSVAANQPVESAMNQALTLSAEITNINNNIAPVPVVETKNECSELQRIEPKAITLDREQQNISMAVSAFVEMQPKKGTGSQILRCRFCHKSFVGYFRWQRHERVHTGFKPCACKHCGRRFSEQRNLLHHMLRFHGGEGVDNEDHPRLLRQMHRRRERSKGHQTSSGPRRRSGVGGGGTSTSSQRLSFVSPAMVATNRNNSHNAVFPISVPHHDDDDANEAFNDTTTSDTLIASSGSANHRQTAPSHPVTSDLNITAPAVLQSSQSVSNSDLESKIRQEQSLSDDVTVVIPADVKDEEEQASSGKPWNVINVSPSASITNANISTRSLSDILSAPMKSSIDVNRNEVTLKNSTAANTTTPSSYMFMDAGMDRRSVNSRLNQKQEKTSASKKFTPNSDLNRHMDFHEDIRPYKCNFCDYFARTNSQLKVHMMRHQGIRDFHCKQCRYRGVTQSDLNRHTKSQVHLLKQFNICSQCGEGFVTANHQMRHRCPGSAV